MKHLITTTLFLALFHLLRAQTFSLQVANGYGDGMYAAGDTVHIWARSLSGTELFSGWSGANVQDAEEWHTWIIMPAQATTITANIASISAIVPVHLPMMGRDTLKEVYYHFPSNYKGVVYFFHGSNGSATGWITFNENLTMVKEVVADSYAVVITEAEEVTRNMDADSDGALRWSPDTLMADYDNIRIITDSLIAWGLMSPTDLRYALGMSNGTSFATTLAARLGFDGVVAFCSPGFGNITVDSRMPTMYVMASQDQHPSVGAAGNAAALLLHDSLQGLGVCSDFRSVPASPLYRERFARVNGVSENLSRQLADELMLNGWLDTQNFLNSAPDAIVADILNDSISYPVYHSNLNSLQRADYANELAATFADHQFNVEFAKKVLQFLDNPCFTTGIAGPAASPALELYPNPAGESFAIRGTTQGLDLSVVDMLGRRVLQAKSDANFTRIESGTWPAGVYLIQVEGYSPTRLIHR